MYLNEELCLKEYFYTEAALGGNCDKEHVFFSMAKTFLIEDERVVYLRALIFSAPVAEIRTRSDYYLFRRLEGYLRSSGVDVNVTEDELGVLSCKGEALELAVGDKVFPLKGAPVSTVFNTLRHAADAGNVRAVTTLGTCLYEGYLSGGSKDDGLNLLLSAARWRHLPALFAAISYSGSSRESLLAVLKAETEGTPYAEIYRETVKAYGAIDEPSCGNAELLGSLFMRGTVDRNVVDKSYLKLVYSPYFSLKDKKHAAFTGNRQLVSEIVALPAGASSAPVKVNEKAFEALSALRKAEAGSVADLLSDASDRAKDGYKPACLVCDSPYVAKKYVSALKNAFAGANFISVDLDALSDRDFEPTGMNVLLRSIESGVVNVAVISVTGRCSDYAKEAVLSFLSSAKRRSFEVKTLGVSLDLSAVLPVLMCDGQNARFFAGSVKNVNLSDVGESEKTAVVAEALSKLSADKKAVVTADDKAKRILTALSPENAEALIEYVCRSVKKGDQLVLTAEMLESSGFTLANKFGFCA